MNKAQESGFQFDGFHINKSLIEIIEVGEFNLGIKISPSAILKLKENKFLLKLIVSVTDKESEKVNIEVETTGIFDVINVSKENISTLERLLFLNAPAILFPYIRAYITNLTAQSGIDPVVLPTLNLTSMVDELKENYLRQD